MSSLSLLALSIPLGQPHASAFLGRDPNAGVGVSVAGHQTGVGHRGRDYRPPEGCGRCGARRPMTENTPPNRREAHATPTDRYRIDGLDARSMRARTEPMDVALVSIGRYAVTTRTGQEYLVDVLDRDCTCPDWQSHEPSGGCKHMRRVNLEILAGRVPRPDGRLPRSVVADGGQPAADGPSEPGQARSDSAGIEGPFWERDPYGGYTGVTYYRCQHCGVEALRRVDLREHRCGRMLHEDN